MKRKRKSEKVSTMHNLDRVWSLKVKERAKNKCEYCGKNTYLNSHHIFSRSNMSVRWDLQNGICLCPAHHTLSNFSAHKAPLEFGDWIREKRGDVWYEALRQRSKDIKKWQTDELKMLLRQLEGTIF